MRPPVIKKRLHLDFHNHPTVRGIGSRMTADGFAQSLQDLGTDSVVLFAKCHHGMSYYPTSVAYAHPGLACNLLAEQVKACESAGIEYHFYLSVLRENYAYEAHPEWRWVGTDMNPSAPGAEYRMVCINTGYFDHYLKPQIEEVLDLHPGAAGIWLDIIRYKGNACACENCTRDAQKLGLSPQEFNTRMLLDKYSELQRLVKDRGKELTLNTIVFMGNQDWRRLTPLEIESILAHVGPFHFPLYSRYLSRYPCEKFGITHSFYQNWREFGTVKNPIQMRYEAAQMAFANFGVSLGDELEPDGTFDKRRFPVLKAGYQTADLMNRACDFATTPVPEAAVIAAGQEAAMEDGQAQPKGNRDSFVRGALKALLEAHYQVAIIDPEEDYSPYKFVVLEAAALESAEIRERVGQYMESGGRALVMGSAGAVGLEWLGLKRTGTGNAGYQFIELAEGERHLLRSRAEKLETTSLATAMTSCLPFGDEELGSREADCIRPPDPAASFGSVFVNHANTLVYCQPDILSGYYDRGNWVEPLILGRLLDRLGVHAYVRGRIPASAEVSLFQGDSGLELRVLDCSLKRENVSYAQQTEYDIIRRYRFEIEAGRRVTRVTDRLRAADVPFSTEDGRVVVELEASEPFVVLGLT